MSKGRKEYTFLWFIENYSYCWHQNGERLVSPEFTPEGLQGTSWNLVLYPRGKTYGSKANISLFLCRSEYDEGPGHFWLNYDLSVLAADGSILRSENGYEDFEKGFVYGNNKFVSMKEILLEKNIENTPQDTLSIRCKIWKDEGSFHTVGKYSARTRIGIQKITFLRRMENFSALKVDESNTLWNKNIQNQHLSICSSLHFTDGDGKVFVSIAISDRNYVLSIRKISLLDRSGDATECGAVDNRMDPGRENIQMPLSLKRQTILNRKTEYLPNDVLSLICDCTFSTGVEFQKIEEIQYELPKEALKHNYNNACSKDDLNAAANLSTCSSALDDLKTIYNNQCFTDVELKTETKSFLAHKLVLCARSPVFNAMLTKDMKEKITSCIHVDDLENDTIQQFLFFLYSDDLENLQWESATKLYYAADKYEVAKLKVICSSFLLHNVDINTAGELLLLADMHNDSNLKKLVEDFILKHEEEVFGSDEWEKLIETNPQLVIKTMHLKYKRGKKR